MKMKAIKFAVAALLLAPVLALADGNNGHGNGTNHDTVTTFTFSFTDMANKTIDVDGIGFTDVNVRWRNLLAHFKHEADTIYKPIELSWSVTSMDKKLTFLSGTVASPGTAASPGVITFDESTLTGTQYKFNFSGTWSGSATGIEEEWHHRNEKVFVDGFAAANEVVINPSIPSSVPEPETYAMLLAGLGLMGTIAMRRKSNHY
jgi:hypothetical protein